MRSPTLLAVVTVGLLTACSGSSGTSATPASTSAAVTASSSTARPVAGDAGAGAKYAPVVCKAIKDTLAGLEGQDAVDAAYQAQMVLAMSGTDVPPADLKAAMDDAAVGSRCPDDLKDFLEKANITSLSGL